MIEKATKLAMELKELISRFGHRSFTANLCYMSNAHVRQRSGQVKLKSPVRQLMYLVNLYHATDFKGNEIYTVTSNDHKRIVRLLNEIERGYGYNASLAGQKELSEGELNRLIVTNSTFLNYYLNAPLSYLEQDIERIRKTFQHFEPFIISETGLGIDDYINFFIILANLEIEYFNRYFNNDFNNDPVLEILRREKNPNKLSPDQKVQLIDLAESAIYNMAIPLSDIFDAIGKEKAIILLAHFTLLRSDNPEYLYYTDACQYLRRPIIMMDSDHIVMIYSKQLINAIYEFLFELCSTEVAPGRKVSERRDEYLEEKTFEVFNGFFDRDAQIYSSYYINGNEKDLLILAGTNAFIIECKANKYRIPFRDPLKAYNRINDDFKKSIGKAYCQAKEVEDLIYGKESFVIKDKQKRVLATINPKDYENVFVVVVTQERFGQIQCNLAHLLTVGDEDNYPWAVAIDDLESFLITLKRKDNYLSEFHEFLLAREQLQGRLFCSDELELCAYFLFDRESFVRNCRRTKIFISSPDMNQFFDLLYNAGFGFKDELNLSNKIERKHYEAESVIKYYKLKPAERVLKFLSAEN